MSIPAELEAILYEIRNALYGQEVRESIADSLEYVYESAEEFKDSAEESAEEARDAADDIQGSARKIDEIDDFKNVIIDQCRVIDITPSTWTQGGIYSASGSISNSAIRVRTGILRGSCDAIVINAPTNLKFATFAYVFSLSSSSYVGILNEITPVDSKGKMVVPVTKGLAYAIICGYNDDSSITPSDAVLANIKIYKAFGVSSERELQSYNYGMTNRFKTNGRPFMWDKGTFNDSTGATLNNDYYIRTRNKIPIVPGITIEYSGPSEEYLAGHIYFFDKNDTFMFRKGYIDAPVIVPEDAAAMNITYGHTTASGILITDGFDMVNKFAITITNDRFSKFLSNIGYIPFNLEKGYWRQNGNINPDTTGICCSKLFELPVGTKIKVFIRGPWVYTVMQGDESNRLTRTDRLVNYDEIVTSKAFVGITFYKLDDDGTSIDVQPSDFDNNVLFFISGNTTTRELEIHDMPENIGVLNVINRAYQMAKLTYTPIVNLPTQVNTTQYPGYVPAGVEVEGVMYSSVRNEGLYVPQCVSLDSYMTALKNPHSYVYTKTEPDPHYNALTYYGAVCSSMVAWCYGILDVVPTTISFSTYPGMEIIENQSPYGLKLGDMLNNPGNHIVIITDIYRDNRGVIGKIEVTEQVNYSSHPMTRHRYLTPDQIQTSYFDNGYIAMRYHYIYKVPYTASPWINLDNEADEPTWNTNLSPRRGDKANWRQGEAVEIDVTDAEEYTNYKLFKNGNLITTLPIPSDNLIRMIFADTEYGSYKVCLTDGTNDSDFVYFNFIDTSVIYTPLGNKQVKVEYSSENGVPSSICFCEARSSDSDYKAVRGFYVLSDAEVSAGEVVVTAPTTDDRTSWLMKVMFKTDFGLYSSDLIEVTVN